MMLSTVFWSVLLYVGCEAQTIGSSLESVSERKTLVSQAPTSSPSPPPPPTTGLVCATSDPKLYLTTSVFKDAVKDFCAQVTKDGLSNDDNEGSYVPIDGNGATMVWNAETLEALEFRIDSTSDDGTFVGVNWSEDDCVKNVGNLGDRCPVFSDLVKYNYGGWVAYGGMNFTVTPQWRRQLPIKGVKAVCGTWYRPGWYKWEVHGAGFMSTGGQPLKDWTNHDAGWAMDLAYTPSGEDDPRGMDWVGWGKYRVNAYTEDFIRNAVKQIGGGDDCIEYSDWPWPSTPY